jgi:hypothetical protein
MGREKQTRKLRFPGGFLAIPHCVSNSIRYRRLSAISVKLLIDIGNQYNGKNNGDLCATWSLMRPRGWKSEDTLNRAKRELLQAGFIAETRKGRRPNLCSLYGLTWFELNPSIKFDIGPSGFPYGAWSKAEEIQVVPEVKNKNATTLFAVKNAA